MSISATLAALATTATEATAATTTATATTAATGATTAATGLTTADVSSLGEFLATKNYDIFADSNLYKNALTETSKQLGTDLPSRSLDMLSEPKMNFGDYVSKGLDIAKDAGEYAGKDLVKKALTDFGTVQNVSQVPSTNYVDSGSSQRKIQKFDMYQNYYKKIGGGI